MSATITRMEREAKGELQCHDSNDNEGLNQQEDEDIFAGRQFGCEGTLSDHDDPSFTRFSDFEVGCNSS